MGSQLKIFFSEDSYLTELEMSQKGWRGDIVVEFEGQTYMVEFITFERLTNEYRFTIQDGRDYVIYTTTIIVDSTDNKTIIDKILNFCQSHSLSNLRKVDLKEKFNTTFVELQDLNNWVQVY